MTIAYVQAWLIALAITQLTEVPVYLTLTRVGVWRALSLSFVTHPVLWFVIAPLFASAGLPDMLGIAIAELLVWLAEAALLRRYGEPWRLALLASLAANATSIIAGELCRHYLGIP